MGQRSERSSKGMPAGLKIPIVAIPVIILGALLPTFSSTARLIVLSARGRTYQCSLAKALDAERLGDDRARRRVAIKASAKLLQSDDEFNLWQTRDGDFWIPKRNTDALIFNLSEEEQDVYGQGAIGVRSGDVVLDGGANVGVFTRKALNAGARTVIAIEPAPENVETLRRNFATEIASGRVVLQPVGLWNQPSELPLNVNGDNSARDSFVLDPGARVSTVMVPLRTIDSLVETLALSRVDFIKLDIEGAEKKALAGARQTLNRFHPRLAIAMEHLTDDPIAIPAAINSMGLNYITVCGPCFGNGISVRPDTLYFTPRSD